MDTDKAIKLYLQTKTIITDLIGDKIVDTYIGRFNNENSAYLIFENVPGSENFSNLTEQSKYLNKNYLFRCVANTNNKESATQLREALRETFLDLKKLGATELIQGVSCHNVIYQDEFSNHQLNPDRSEKALYEFVIEFSFSFKKSST